MTGEDEKSPPPGEPRTVFSPATGFSSQLVTGETEQPAVAPPSSLPEPGGQSTAASKEPRQIKPGDVLNHIFEVQQFIARGGMGEVFEGININSEERVAIKVILPHLAADPAIQAMFRKEARTLTKLSHAALVQYRVLAQEPQLGVFYIVTEYVDGRNLSTILKEIHPGPAELTMLAKRLAEGLSAAHALGAIHRDISPDNVLLESGRLDLAKIIDFGIAKDLDASTGTIVGDGFAGKLNYVAPEQLGDFNREVGPWTDVYSLGLTILAVAMGRDVDMGATLVDAVDKRRAGPDLSPIPESLRPVLQKMLQPNPVDRARSMEEVLQMLADPIGKVMHAPPPLATKAAASPAKPPRNFKAMMGRMPGKAAMAGAGTVAVLLLVGSYFLFGGKDTALPAPAETSGPAGQMAVNPATTAREALAAGLDGVPCAWLDLTNAEGNGAAVALAFRGVAGKPAEVQGAIGKMLADKGVQAGSIDFSDVSPIDANECSPIEAFRKIRSLGTPHLSVAQRSFQMIKLGPEAGADAGKMGAQAVVNLDLNGLTDEVALVGLEPSGAITGLTMTRAELAQAAQQPQPGVFRLQISTTHAGWSGMLMLTGKAPFDASLLTSPAGSHGGDWSQRFLALAAQRGWKAEMVWYRTTE